ncbi:MULTISPECIES: ExbD/TolR family protein [Abyssibacter]|uniref:Biopolymer transporter ExbD n=1 Tax=Abyssibacter profundi TaxID=2182787 RepID=A0A383XR00_9GAMM|nr:biopolymer transporter ExbD [Abyssibacter profundi]MBV62067.1 biopolymer transporter ExbD [Nevskiales bacterium]MEC9408293.1 biopolymer transporter ExbD [Pseudomonadota bacterium]PWN55054.1 biopolymer transporter ExbD [Abyssibacter profundi]
MARSFSSQDEAEEEGNVDLTPMLDVVFIMLIFFIVTATFVKETGVEVNRPQANTADQKNNPSVLIAIREDNSIWVDQRRIDIRSVRANIERLHAENPEGGVVIQADELASVKTFTEVLDQAREVVPPEKVSLATENGG